MIEDSDERGDATMQQKDGRMPVSLASSSTLIPTGSVSAVGHVVSVARFRNSKNKIHKASKDEQDVWFRFSVEYALVRRKC